MAVVNAEAAMENVASCLWPNPAAYLDWERHLMAPASVVRCTCQCHEVNEPWCYFCANRHMETVLPD
jgi:hypothetical protein